MSVPDVLVKLVGIDNMRGAHRLIGHALRLVLEAIADVAVGIAQWAYLKIVKLIRDLERPSVGRIILLSVGITACRLVASGAHGEDAQRDRREACARMWLSISYRPSGLLVLPLLPLVIVPEVEHVEHVPDRGDVGRYVG